jgi:hypothetical protein
MQQQSLAAAGITGSDDNDMILLSPWLLGCLSVFDKSIAIGHTNHLFFSYESWCYLSTAQMRDTCNEHTGKES